jgi:hypothetical protein
MLNFSYWAILFLVSALQLQNYYLSVGLHNNCNLYKLGTSPYGI